MDGKVPFDHGKGFRLKVADSTPATGGKRRLILDAWGNAARALIDWLDSAYVMNITRLDYRRELRGITREHVRGYLTQKVLGKKGGRNIVTYDTNDRQKTDTRDVGGYGLTIGSRKSDAHTTIYQRGSEPAAIEHRFQGNKAADIAAKAMGPMFDDEEPFMVSEYIMRELSAAARVELNQATGYTNYDKLALAMVDSAGMMKLVQDSMTFAEDQADADEWWQTLSREEQEEMQQGGFIPSDTLQPRLRDPRRVEGVLPPPDMRHED